MKLPKHLAEYAAGTTIVSIVLFVAGLVAMAAFVIYMPADHFTRHKSKLPSWCNGHPALRWTWLIGKNVIGVVFLVLGLAMLVIPGPGVLMLLIGLSLVDIPGKRQLELRLVRMPKVRKKIDGIRAKYGQPPLEIPDDDAAAQPANSTSASES